MIIQPTWTAPNNIKAFTTTREYWDAETSSVRIDLPTTPIWLKQTHSTIALPATSENRFKEGDASYTRALRTICAVLTADCLPILLCNQQGTFVAALHAGWRGLANGIIESTLATSKEPSNQLLAWLGPAIGPHHFEVGADVYDAFVSQDKDAKEAFKPLRSEKWLANLSQLATLRLNKNGVTAVFNSNECTYSQYDRFFSYRRDKDIGRMATLIWME